MASNYSVKIHLESYFIKYVIKFYSKNKENPVIFKSGSGFLINLMPKLISKREYDHRIIVEAKYINDRLKDTIEIMLPWTKGKIDVRYKHYISPLDELKYRNFIKQGFPFLIEMICKKYMSEGHTFREAMNKVKKIIEITNDPNFNSFSKNLYRKFN